MTPYQQNSNSYRFASFLLGNPRKSVLLGLTLLALLVPGLSKLQSDFSYRIWFRQTDPLLAVFDTFERQFGNDEMVAVIVHSPSGIFDKESVKLVQDLTNAFWYVDEVIRVDSLSNYNWTHSEDDELTVEPLLDDELIWSDELIEERKRIALKHELIPGYLVSDAGDTAIFYLQLKPAIGGTPDFERVINSTRETVARFEGHGDHTFYITGPSAISNTFKEVTQSDLKKMVPALLVAITVFLLLFFRNIAGLLVPMFVVFASIFATLGFAGWMGIKFNNLTAIVPNILIAIGVADTVHILVTFYQFRGQGMERFDAAHATLTKNLLPTLLTSISTAIGFFSFASAVLLPIMYMGILAGVGTLVAWLITIFLISPLLPHLPGKFKIRKGSKTDQEEAHPLAVTYVAWLHRNGRLVVGIFLLITVVSVYLALQNEVNSNPLEYFAKNVHTRVANDFAEKHVGGMSAVEIVIDSGKPDGIKDPGFLQRAEAYQDWLNTLPHISKTVSVINVIRQTNRALNNDDQNFYKIPDNQGLIAQEIFLYTMSLPQGMDLNNRMTLDNSKLRITAMSNEHESKVILKEIDKIEAKAEVLGLKAHVTGKMPLYQQMNSYVVSAFLKSISMALVLVSLLMLIVLRDWRLGLLAMVPNTAPLLIGAAIMYILEKPLDIGTVLVAATCLGIAVDDTIHFMANYQRWRKFGVNAQAAVAHVITHTGPALFVTTTVLVAGFATFAFSSFVPNVNFGILTAIVLCTALITDATLLPVLLMRSGNPNLQEVRPN